MSGKLDMVNSNRYRLACEQDATFSRQFTIKDANGDLIDLSGYTGARMEVRAGEGGPTFSRGKWSPRSDSVDAWYSAIGLAGASGADVDGWPDSSDQNNDATLNGLAGTYTLIGGYPFVAFGAGQSLAAPFSLSGPWTLALYRKITATGSAVMTVAAESRQLEITLNANGTTREWRMNGRTMLTKWDVPTLTEATPSLDILSYTSDYETICRTNGVAYTPDVLSTADMSSTNETVIGPNATFGDIIFFDRALDTGEMQTVEGYIARKWGLSLPSTHPFYTKTPTGLVEDAPVLSASVATGEIAINTVESTVTVVVPASVTKYLTPGMYYYDLVLTDTTDRNRILEGRFEITPRTTLG